MKEREKQGVHLKGVLELTPKPPDQRSRHDTYSNTPFERVSTWVASPALKAPFVPSFY